MTTQLVDLPKEDHPKKIVVRLKNQTTKEADISPEHKDQKKIVVRLKKTPIIKEANVSPERKEVQAHGFSWEQDIILNVYGSTLVELRAIKYNSRMDLPRQLNHLDSSDLSIKTSHNPNTVCMADCLRIFDAVSSGQQFHMVVINYKQDDITMTKKVTRILEIDLTSSTELLFGQITRSQIEELVKMVKAVPQKRKPTAEEYTRMYSFRNQLQEMSGAIHLDIKCNSTQSRLQCSFNQFQSFVKNYPSRVVAISDSQNPHEFRGGKIAKEISSSRRVFKKIH